jgi:hypothetical protein
MAALVLKGFAGMRPLVDPRLLNDAEAQYALNARLQSGALVPYKTNGSTAITVGQFVAANVRKLYPVLNNTKWMSWTTEVDVIESPILEDQYDRVYWTGDSFPKYGPKMFVAGGNAPYPSQYYRLGLPKPANTPIATGAVVSDATTQTREYAVTFLNAAGTKESALGVTAKTTVLSNHYDFGLYPATLAVVGTTVTVTFTNSHEFELNDYLVVVGVSGAFKVLTIPDGRTLTFDRGATAVSAGSANISKRILARVTLSGLPLDDNGQSAVTQKRIYRKVNDVYRRVATIPLTQTKYEDDALDADLTSAPTIPTGAADVPPKPVFAPTATLEIDDESTVNVPDANLQKRVYAVSWVDETGYESPLSNSSGFIGVVDGTSRVKLVHGGEIPEGAEKKRIYRQNVTVSSEGTFTVTEANYKLVIELPASQTTYTDSATTASLASRAAPTNPDALTPPDQPFAASGNLQPTRNAETRVYVYTYVTEYGEEGPPSEPSESVDIDPESPVTVSNISGAPTGNYNVTKIYLYRSATGNAATSFQFVKEVLIGVSSTQDNVPQASLGEVLPSTDWLQPPSDLQGLRLMANGIAIGWSQEKTICFSEPYLPSAWPAGARLTVEFPVVGMGVFGQSAAILTKAHPYIVTGVDPKSMTVQKLPLEQACVSKRSIVETENGIIYASPDGLVMIGAGGARVLTAGVLSQAQWQAYNPSSIHGYWHENRYLGFCTVNSAVKMFIFDPTGQTATWCETDVVAYAGHRVVQDDNLYVLTASGLESLFAGNSNRTYRWISKIAALPSPINMSFGQVIANTYPVTLKVTADGTERTYTVTSSNPFRLHSGFLAREWYVEITGTSDVTGVALAQSAWELKNL